MKNYKFQLSPNQEINLANKGLIYQNGKAVFNKETSQELTKTIQEALNKKHLKKETIFTDNKSNSIDISIIITFFLFKNIPNTPIVKRNECFGYCCLTLFL